MKRKAYPKYKPSGVEWLGEVPEHWELIKNRYIFTFRGGGTPSTENLDFWGGSIPWVSSKDMKSFFINDTEDHISNLGLVESSTNIIPANTMVVVMRSGILIHSIPASVLKNDMAINQDIKAFIPLIQIESSFTARFIEGFQKQLLTEWRKEGATVESLDMELIKSFYSILPPFPEQQAIAVYLDRETNRIDSLIEKKQRLLSLLAERRTALISRVVTKGLDSNAKMKPSGAEWLGDVPEHWEVKALKYLFMNLDSRRIPLAGEDRAGLDKIYPYYGASGIIDYVDDYIYNVTLILVAEDGANLFSRSSPLAFRAEGKYWVNNHAHILSPKYEVITYWESVLQVFDYTPYVSGSAQPKLTADNLGSFLLPVPPLSEQQAIAAYLDRETAKIDALSGKVETIIERLKEYRTALISEAVTGKIDVREAI